MLTSARQRVLGMGAAGEMIKRLGIAFSQYDLKSAKSRQQLFSSSWPGHGAYLESMVSVAYISWLVAEAFNDRLRCTKRFHELSKAALEVDFLRLEGAFKLEVAELSKGANKEIDKGSEPVPYWSERIFDR